MQYDQLRDEVEKRKPGWEHLQEVRLFYPPMMVLLKKFVKTVRKPM